MPSKKRNVLTVAAVIATTTMAAGLGSVALVANRAPVAHTPASQTGAQTAPAPTWVDDAEGGG